MTSSDAIVSCDINEQIDVSSSFGASNNAFALLAHKSSLTVGKDHGVYAIAQNATSSLRSNNLQCEFVLQKPSIDRMNDKKVVLYDEEIKEYVYTDSEIYFSHEVTKILRQFYEKFFDQIVLEKIEIDAWRDFLQPLGSRPISLDDYLLSANSWLQMFVELYELLLGKETSVISLFDSHFFHLGTTSELLDFYLDENSQDSLRFRKSICFTNQKFNRNNINDFENLKGCIYYSKVNEQSKLNAKSLIEFTFIDEGIRLCLGDFAFVNNCMLSALEMPELRGAQIEVPSNVFMHTISIKVDNGLRYVTIFFDKDDNVKKVYKDLKSLIFLGKHLPDDLIKAMENPKKNSVWGLKIFNAEKTMSESFVTSLRFIKAYLNGDLNDMLNEKLVSYSMFDLLEMNDCEDMIEFRERNNF